MKNQYFGDINDYRKYGVLRGLLHAGLKVGVHWMLTPDDQGRDGRKLAYLDAERRWRAHDPPLFDFLCSTVRAGTRNVQSIADSDLLRGARFFADYVPDRGRGRAEHTDRALTVLRDSAVIFFDPDNGLEVPSTPHSAANSNKYVLWSELAVSWKRGHSLLVYQHYPRVRRSEFESRLAQTCLEKFQVSPRFLRTGNVLFLLLPRPEHLEEAAEAVSVISQRWRGQVLCG